MPTGAYITIAIAIAIMVVVAIRRWRVDKELEINGIRHKNLLTTKEHKIWSLAGLVTGVILLLQSISPVIKEQLAIEGDLIRFFIYAQMLAWAIITLIMVYVKFKRR